VLGTEVLALAALCDRAHDRLIDRGAVDTIQQLDLDQVTVEMAVLGVGRARQLNGLRLRDALYAISTAYRLRAEFPQSAVLDVKIEGAMLCPSTLAW
jgi:hypothetical protein